MLSQLIFCYNRDKLLNVLWVVCGFSIELTKLSYFVFMVSRSHLELIYRIKIDIKSYWKIADLWKSSRSHEWLTWHEMKHFCEDSNLTALRTEANHGELRHGTTKWSVLKYTGVFLTYVHPVWTLHRKFLFWHWYQTGWWFISLYLVNIICVK